MSGTLADSLVPVGQPATQVSHIASAAHDRMDVALTAAEGSVRAAGTHLGPPVSAADAVGASMVGAATFLVNVIWLALVETSRCIDTDRKTVAKE